MFDSIKATYSYTTGEITPAATPTDVLVLTGSNSKIIRVQMLEVIAEASSSSVLDFYLYKRTAANTGGTKTNPAATKNDSTDDDATAIIALYSANPSALGAGSIIRSNHYALPDQANTKFSGPPWIETFGRGNLKPIILRNASESIALNLNGQALPSGFNIHATMEWTEENR